MNKQTKKYILNISIMLIVTGLAIFFVLKDDASAVFDSLATANIWYILIGLGLIMITFLSEALILFVLARLYNDEYKYRQGFFNFMIGRFFCGITPSASGGQFAQAYTFNKQGVSLTSASSILVMMFIVYQFSLILFGGSTLIGCVINGSLPDGTMNVFGLELDVITLSIIAFALTSSMVIIMFVLALNKNVHRFVINLIANIGVFLKIIKKNKKEEKIIAMNTKLEIFRIELKRLFSNIKVLITVLILFLINLFAFNCIPYFCFKACNVDLGVNNFMNSMAYSSFTYMVTQLIPIPGASGGAELFFNLMYAPYVNDVASLKSAILIWRTVTFFFGLIFGGLVTIFYHESPKLQMLHYSDKTLLEIQVIHIDNEYKKYERTEEYVSEPIMIEDVTTHFEKIKEELEKQLQKNARSLSREEKKKKKVESDEIN